ncbi:hypothetical protein WJX84_011614 [Apatococcus fuscideae]|uniref:Uncharacterized protein n=1 Tax=Apatococcus fuscideae TaxID=2026836 RepID=A0AAW1TEQ6_9CHLO
MVNPLNYVCPDIAASWVQEWAKDPKAAAKKAELLTRDADAPEDASGQSIQAPPPSALAKATVHNGQSLMSSAKIAATKAQKGDLKGASDIAAHPEKANGHAVPNGNGLYA